MRKKTRKVINRSGHGECSICKEEAPLVEHHIRGRKIPNANHPSNLCSVCPNCHSKVHLGMIIIEKWCGTMSGTELFWHKKGEESFTGEDAHTYTY